MWHTHEDTDELFLVIDGELTIQLRNRDVVLGPGRMFVVPRGVEHCPRADDEVKAVLIEPTGVINTGKAGGELTAVVEHISVGHALKASGIARGELFVTTKLWICLLYTSPSPRDGLLSRMPSSA